MTDPKTEPTSQSQPPPSPPRKEENIVAALLKTPEKLSDALASDKGLLTSSLTFLAVAGVCHAIFGFAVGLFAGGDIAVMDFVKAPLVAIGSLFICFPSLYVFACVSGSPLSISQTLALGSSCIAMVGFLLIGLAPVVWLFAVSTASLPFMVILILLVWLIAMSFAARYVGKLKANTLFQRQSGIKVWFLILAIVTLQMATCMRPMLGTSERGWLTTEKKFFLSHFGSAFKARSK